MSASICPCCGARFQKAGPWMTTCPSCWGKARKAEREALVEEVLLLREEVVDLRQRLQAVTARPAPAAIPADMVARLIRLSHPDKHAGSDASNVATSWLLQQRQAGR